MTVLSACLVWTTTTMMDVCKAVTMTVLSALLVSTTAIMMDWCCRCCCFKLLRPPVEVLYDIFYIVVQHLVVRYLVVQQLY